MFCRRNRVGGCLMHMEILRVRRLRALDSDSKDVSFMLLLPSGHSYEVLCKENILHY